MDYPTRYATGSGVVLSWASLLDDNTRLQAEMISRSEVVKGHVALMPDAHLGMGATVGCVIPTKDAIIPAAVGVDIGCGMIARHTSLKRGDIALEAARLILGDIRRRIPSGVGEGHATPSDAAEEFFASREKPLWHVPGLIERGMNQFGTLGSGNHFVEVSSDQNEDVWLVLHSGSRGIGNQIAMYYIKQALEECVVRNVQLEHKDLAYLRVGTNLFEWYIHDMLWAQAYAWAQREEMMRQLDAAVATHVSGEVWLDDVETIHCHHNYSEKQPDGTWLSRKGAINAEVGSRGIIPGSMGAETHIVTGLGNPESYCSAPHGAGRLLSRGGAKKTLSLEEFKAQMQNITWNDRDAQKLLDEAPFAYKPIKQVMQDAASLVRTDAVLSQFINFKGA